MKVMLKRISDICKLIFGYGIMITLFAGGLTFIGYMTALFIGGEIATAICIFIYKKVFPIITYATTCLVLFGLIAMYLGGEVALTTAKKKDKPKQN